MVSYLHGHTLNQDLAFISNCPKRPVFFPQQHLKKLNFLLLLLFLLIFLLDYRIRKPALR